MSSSKVAIVTAAGRGMGAAIARELAAGGYALALLSPSGAAEKLAEELGAIVNISTFSAFEPSLDYPVSSTLRAGLGSFAKLYAERYAADNIRMNNILPGFIDSLPHGEDKAVKAPMRRIGTVAEIARTAAFLLGDGAGYITGQNLRVDGGLTRGV